MRTLAVSLMALAPLVLGGCVTDDDCCNDDRAPLPPVGVTSITGDRAVLLRWIENQEPDLEGYRIYVSLNARGPYERVGFSRDNEYLHDDLSNGTTYYYGVSALDEYGNESDLNDTIIFDTPRPEGFDLRLYEADGDDADLSGYDFSRERREPWDDLATDVYYDWVGDTPFLAVPDYATDIQDAGYVGFDDVTWAPDGGWSPSGIVEAIPGHLYVIWTRDDHFAKVRVVAVDEDTIELDWAYQSDRGNPELRKAGAGVSRPRPAP
jgi:hypothetical protein